MPLKLTITSYQRLSPGQEIAKTIDRQPVTIGRAAQNDWVLQDPERILSKHHCTVLYRDGAYFLTDFSVNGTYLNDSEQRIARNQTIELRDGDHFALGEYEIAVSVQNELDSASDPFADGPFTDVVPPAAAPSAGGDPFGADPLSAADPLKNNPSSKGWPYSSTPPFDDILSAKRDRPDGLQPGKPASGRAATAPAPDLSSPERVNFELPALVTGFAPAQPDAAPEPPPAAIPLIEPPSKPAFSPAPPAEPLSKPAFSPTPPAEPLSKPLLSPAPTVEPVSEASFKPAATPLVEPLSKPAFSPAPPAEPSSKPQLSPTPTLPEPGFAVQPAPATAALPPTTAPAVSDPKSKPPLAVAEPGLNPLIPDDWFLQAVSPPPAAPAPPRPAFEPPKTPPVATPLAPPIAPATAQPPASGAAASAELVLRLFCKGAGLSHLRLEKEQVAELAFNLGAILRETVQGLMEILLARGDVKGEFRLDRTTLGPVENNPLKTPPGRLPLNPEDVIKLLLVPPKDAYLPPVQAVRESFEDIKAHQLAVVAGIQAALNRLLERFDPGNLEDRLEQNVLDNLWPANRKAKYWDLFTAEYQAIAREAEDDFNKLFGDEFARAYESRLRGR